MPAPSAVSCASDGGNVPAPCRSTKAAGTAHSTRQALRRRQRHLLLPRVFCRRDFARCGITKLTVFPFAFALCGRAKSKIRFRRFFIYCRSFPDSFDSATVKRGTVCSVVKGVCSRPRVFCRRVFARCGIDKTDGFPRRQRRRRTKFPSKGKKLVKSAGKLPQQGAKLLKKKLLFDIITQCNATQGVKRRRRAAKGRIYGLQ